MFQTSGSIANLAQALAKAQASMPVIPLDRCVQYKTVNFEYATLSGIIYITKPILASFGLTVLQFPATHEVHVTITTMLLHDSGEWVSSAVTGRLAKVDDPKEIGSIITYLRRYAYAAILTLAVDGDYDSELISERYINTPEQKSWLKEVLVPIGITDPNVMRAVADEMQKGGYEKTETSALKALDKIRSK